MTVVPSSELGLTNTLSPSSPLYYATRECSSPSSSLSPSAYYQSSSNHLPAFDSPGPPIRICCPSQSAAEMERPSNNRFGNCTYSNNANNEGPPYFERKRKMAAIHQQQNKAHPLQNPHQMPDRLQPLISGHEHLANAEVMAQWVASFLPKPEPPRFFRPLCARLSRQQQRLREEQAASARRYTTRMEEVRARLAMSVSEVRAEQKTMLRELRQQRKHGAEQSKGAENGGIEQPQQQKRDGAESSERQSRREEESGDDGEQQQRNGAYDNIFIHYISIRSNE